MRGFIKQYIVHLEWHPGYRPHISIRRKKRPGERVVDGGIPGVLESCKHCSGDGMLVRPDVLPDNLKLLREPVYPEPSQEIHGS